MSPDAVVPAEQRARALIDAQLSAAGWSAQSRGSLYLYTGQGVAVREAVMAQGHGGADYLLYVDQRAAGVIEAKPDGTPLSGVEWHALPNRSPTTPLRGPAEGADRSGVVLCKEA